MKKNSGKSSIISKAKRIDRNPTCIISEDGRVLTPDKEHRFAVAHMKNGERKYLCDGNEISFTDAFGALTGRDSILNKCSVSSIFKVNQYEKIFKKGN